ISEAKSIALNPSAPASAAAPTTGAEAPKSTPATTGAAGPAAVDTSVRATAGGAAAAAAGMSATSGPLDDQLAHGYADEAVVDKQVAEEGVVVGRKEDGEGKA
ncbi:MAG: hypothetical protein Q9177_004272, partial [Variospora cf. flavescens]